MELSGTSARAEHGPVWQDSPYRFHVFLTIKACLIFSIFRPHIEQCTCNCALLLFDSLVDCLPGVRFVICHVQTCPAYAQQSLVYTQSFHHFHFIVGHMEIRGPLMQRFKFHLHACVTSMCINPRFWFLLEGTLLSDQPPDLCCACRYSMQLQSGSFSLILLVCQVLLQA